MARPKRKAATQEVDNDAQPVDSPKRVRLQASPEFEAATPTKSTPVTPSKRKTPGRATSTSVKKQVVDDEAEDGEAELEKPAATPSSRPRGRPKKSDVNEAATPVIRSRTRVIKTPVKFDQIYNQNTPSRRNLADRSARKKSARALIDRVVTGATSDDEGIDEDIEQQIFDSSESEDEEQDKEDENEDDEGDIEATAATPSKKPRGRPKGRKKAPTRKKSPTPPRDLPPHELYFFHNKPGLAKTSNNTLSSLSLLTHDEYFSLLRKHRDPHGEDMKFLQSLHVRSFPQWMFELSQGFSLCLHGFGSKRSILYDFARALHAQTRKTHARKIVVINGYVRTITVREILSTIASAIDPSYKLPSGNPTAATKALLAFLSASSTQLTLILNSIDAPPLRKSSHQAILSQLAAHAQINMTCSVDTPDFSLLWDSGARSTFNFLFHDCTTFAPFTAELEVVDDVHELLGRKARRVGGKDGVAFVLRSLPENAKSLFRLLVGEILVVIDEDDGGYGGEGPGVEYRMLYNKAVEEFICSSEIAFRTLLKEFHDHQMITSRKDILGTELLSVPFRKEELEAVLEDLVM